uniref:SSD domain-containing protein n=1 Tax=Plectus sambesii TaxID=2011161 RepID=A0A914XN12_9BILA
MSVDRVFHKLFYGWGFVAFRFRLLCFLLPLMLTVSLSFGILNLRAQTNRSPEYVFSPENAPWKHEFAVLASHWPLVEDSFWPGKSYDYRGYIDIVVWGKLIDGRRPNMLSVNYLLELERINQFILKNITVDVMAGNETFKIAYRDLCLSYDWKCFENDHVTMLMPKEYWGDFEGEIGAFASEIAEREVHVTYPIAWRGTEPIYLGSIVGAPSGIDDKGNFNYAKAIRLTYNIREGAVANVSSQWKKKLTRYLTQSPPASEILEFGLSHNDSLSDGLLEVAHDVTPKFSITFILLTYFVTLSSLTTLRRENFKGIDWVRSKPLLGFAGVVTPVLATISAFGLVLFCGATYNDIVDISPFLLICKLLTPTVSIGSVCGGERETSDPNDAKKRPVRFRNRRLNSVGGLASRITLRERHDKAGQKPQTTAHRSPVAQVTDRAVRASPCANGKQPSLIHHPPPSPAGSPVRRPVARRPPARLVLLLRSGHPSAPAVSESFASLQRLSSPTICAELSGATA